jgi:amidase
MPPVDVLTATGASLQALLADGSTATEALVDAYLGQIHKHNHHGMRLNAVISVAPRDDLVRRARALGEERRSKGARGPLHGIPLIVKDLYCTASLGMPTTAGMFSLANAKAKRDAVTVERLVEAGAVIIAKANLSVGVPGPYHEKLRSVAGAPPTFPPI